MSEPVSTDKKLDELYDLIDDMDVALMTTRRPDGLLVTRPMAVQKRGELADVWFVTDINSGKVDEIQHDPNVSIGYYNSTSREWVSISGKASINQDRAKIHELYDDDWKIWFEDEGGNKDGGPDDPRFALIAVDAISVEFMTRKFGTPRILFELAKGKLTGEQPDIGQTRTLASDELV
jgi:general stress protein 26